MEDIRGVTSGRALFTSRTKSDYRTCSARAARFTDLAVFIRETFTSDRGKNWSSKSIDFRSLFSLGNSDQSKSVLSQIHEFDLR